MKESFRPVALVLMSSTSLQFGLAIAATTFDEAGPIGAVWVRSLVGALLLGLYIRPRWRAFTRVQIGPIIAYGAALSAMTLFAYLAISRAPLGVVSAILMLGPLVVAAVGQRSAFDLAMVAVAAVGALMLTIANGVSGPVNVLGVTFAFAAAVSFAAYIVFGKRVNQRVEGLGGLALALVVTAGIQTPLGLMEFRSEMLQPEVMLALVAAGVMATLIPFTLEAIALRTLSMATFGLLLAFEPAVAALAGIIIRNDSLTAQQIIGIALIIVAGVGSIGPRGWTRRLSPYNRALMADPRVAALAQVPLFAGLSPRELATIASGAEEHTASPGEVLTREGDDGDEFFVIASGSVRITSGGRELRRLGPGDYLGEIALIFGGSRTATATVEESARLFVVGKDSFMAMLHDQPGIEDKILSTVSERMRYR